VGAPATLTQVRLVEIVLGEVGEGSIGEVATRRPVDAPFAIGIVFGGRRSPEPDPAALVAHADVGVDHAGDQKLGPDSRRRLGDQDLTARRRTGLESPAPPRRLAAKAAEVAADVYGKADSAQRASVL
jgi:hypothetical protein